MTPSPFHGIFSAFGSEQGTVDRNHVHQGVGHQQPELPEQHPTTIKATTGQIAVDIYEVDNYYIIRAPIAGVRLSDLDIEVDEKVITIRGNRSPADDIPRSQFYVQECFWGEFSRSVTLPCIIDPKKVKATFSKDSILKVLVPKEEKVKIVRINES